MGYSSQGADVKSNSTSPSKKPYEKPQVRVYGGVQSLTTAINNMSDFADGAAGMGFNKTS
jgi:hypothetical protein